MLSSSLKSVHDNTDKDSDAVADAAPEGRESSDEFIQFSVAKNKLKTLEKKLSRVDKHLKSVWWKVPKYSQTHIARDVKMLDDIRHRAKTTSPGSDNDDTSVFALLGAGGMGKTETARMWAHELCACVDGNVMWIDAENSSSVNSAFVQLCKRLGISLQDKFGKPTVVGDGLHHHVYQHFGTQKSLFIFDNVRDDAMLQHILPKTNTVFPIILVTSQSKTLRGNIQTYELGRFEERETSALVSQIADNCVADRETRIVGELVNDIPFAVDIASHIISKRGISAEEFVKTFERTAKDEKYEKDSRGVVGMLVKVRELK